MLYILYSLYSILSGIVSFSIFKDDILSVIIFLFFTEIFIYLLFNISKSNWLLRERIIFIILYFIGYFIQFLLYDEYRLDYGL
jgi:hypothetical protein